MSNFSDLFTFVRASTATYKDRFTGLLIDSAIDQERIESDGLIIERSATNLFTYSEYQNDVFTPNTNIITTEVMNFRSGIDSNCAYFDDTVESKYSYRSFSGIVSKTYTLSCFVEMLDGLGAPSFSGAVTSSTRPFTFVQAGGAFTDEITVDHIVGNIYRLSQTLVCASTNSNYGVLRYASNQIRPFKVSGFQLEQASAASSYIPTEASQATRSGEGITRTLAGEFDSTKGTFYLEFENIPRSFLTTFNVLGGPSGGSTRHLIAYNGGTSSYIANNGSFSASYPGGDRAERVEKMAISINGSSWILSRNGTSSSFTATGDSLLDFSELNAPITAWIKNKNFKYWPRALTSAELEDLTS